MKEKYSREFSVADEYAMQQLIQRRARELGKQIEPEALRALSGLVGTDVWRARNEIEKLAHLVADIITANDVRAHTYAFGEEKIWEFIDSLSGGNRARAFFLLEQQFSQGIKPMYLLSMLIRQVRLMMAMFGAPGNDSSLASSLDLHPFVVKKTRLGASKFSLAQLKTMYQALSRLDSALKTGRGEPKLLFTILVDSIVR